MPYFLLNSSISSILYEYSFIYLLFIYICIYIHKYMNKYTERQTQLPTTSNQASYIPDLPRVEISIPPLFHLSIYALECLSMLKYKMLFKCAI